MSNLEQTINDSFIQYAGAVLQNRALIDVRDGLKPSARQIFYSMLLHKLTSDKPHKKTANAVGMAMADFYIHGDASCEGVIMRAGQPFAMRYPLVDVKGNAGSLIASGNWAAMRYTESRLSKLMGTMFDDIDKDTITEWRDSYDNSKQYPAVLPSKGFYNIVNGTMGIGVGMACSVPQFNLKELNNALIYLIDNPECSFEDIYCAPDFATGAILYNEEEVKQSMKAGTGFACKLRSVVEFDQKERCFIVTEIPYGVYTNTICGELEQIIESDENPGVERFNDLTGKTPLIKIYLTKKANPDKVLKYLYKETSLQSYFSINFTMLDNGRFPRVFTWKEMLQAHIDHEKEVYRRGFNFDLKKIVNRIHIIDGLLKAYDVIDEVIQLIKTSSSATDANTKLQKFLEIDDVQAKAILDLRLSKLSKLDITKLKQERDDLEKEAERIEAILNDEALFNQELKNGWAEVARVFGDARRTKIISLADGNGAEPIEQKRISITIYSSSAVIGQELSTLYSQRRNGVGTKFKLDKGEYAVDTLTGTNTDTILFFTNYGRFFHASMSEFPLEEKVYLSNYASLNEDENILAATLMSPTCKKRYIIFLTKNGILKKSSLSEYNLKRNIGAAALKLDSNDEIVSVLFVDDEKIGISTAAGQFIMIETKDISAIGRVARGVIGIKLNANDYVQCARAIPQGTTELVSVTTDGYIKRTSINEFKVTGRGTKGVKIQNTTSLCGFLPITSTNDILITATTSQIRLKLFDIPLQSKDTQGVKSIKLPNSSQIIKISGV